MEFQLIFLHIPANCLILLLMASVIPLILGILLYWVLRQRLLQKMTALEAENAKNHEQYTKSEAAQAGLKYQLEESVKELERLKTALRSSESDVMVLRGRLEHALQHPDSKSPAGVAAAGQEPQGLPIPEKASPGDLKIIEGIGPKVELILKEAGIGNWSDLAAQPIDVLKGLLEKAGPSFRMMDPTTWPQQARLANEGNWEALRVLQAELKGGRKED